MDEQDVFCLVKRLVIKDLAIFNKISMRFLFRLTKQGREPLKLIFAKQDSLIELNFETDEVRELLIFQVPLTKQPEFFVMSNDQTISMIASQDDGIYFNHRTRQFVDIDELYKIQNIKEIIHDHEDRHFYILCNKYKEKLGIFLIRMDENDPRQHTFILRWKNKLDIADCSVYIVRNHAKRFKELVISYKTIFINTYNVWVFDISRDTEQSTLFRHESFQLWESQIRGFYLNKTKDFITINREGINVLSLSAFDKKCVKDVTGQEKMIHSLGSTNYLKVEKQNFILFEFATDIKVISIMHQYTTEDAKSGEETNFEVIYKIRIHDITLRELLLFQSLYVCKTQSDILRLVQSQPFPSVFYKSFLELDCSNMVSILSFDSRSLKQLLDDKNSQYFQNDYPIFYKNKIQKSNNKDKFFYRTAIDSALRNNQIRAVGYIINYVCKYQNNFVTSYMFIKNIPVLMQKGVEVVSLFNSNIFCYQFDYDEWPSTHTDCEFYMRPYNESIFNLRKSYRKIFHEPKFADVTDESADTSKMYKVKYSINMLSMIERYAIQQEDGTYAYENEDVRFMEIAGESKQLDVFDSENVDGLIQYKWRVFA